MFALKRNPALWLLLGLFAGLMAGGIWPHAPLHAVATDRAENAVACTAIVDDSVEGYFYLDSVTGMLMGGVPSRQGKGPFQASWTHNVTADLNGVLKGGRTGNAAKNPKYLMTSGTFDFRGTSGRERPGRSLLYITEVNTGVVLAYTMSWSPESHAANQAYVGRLVPWSFGQLATIVERD